MLPVLSLFFFTAWGLSAMGGRDEEGKTDALFQKIWTASPLSREERSYIQGLSDRALEAYLLKLSAPRQRAAGHILEWSGLRPAFQGFSQSKEPLPSLLHQGNQALERGACEEAEGLYRRYWKEKKTNEFCKGEQLLKIRKAVLRSGRASAWIPLLKNWTEPEASGFEGFFFLASCLEQTGQNHKAERCYAQALERSSQGEEKRRIQWYRMRLILEHAEEDFITFLKREGPFDNRGAYFDDLLDDYFSRLVRSRRWEEMDALVLPLLESGLKEPFYQLIFLLEKAPQPFQPSERSRSYFGLFPTDPRSYLALRQAPLLWPVPPAGQTGIPVSSPSTKEADEFYSILLEAGYMNEALRLWEKEKEALSLKTVMAYGEKLREENRLYDMIRFTGYWYYRFPSSLTAPLIPLVYPGTDRYDLSPPGGDKHSVPPELILGVIRRESAFKEDALSFAGAVGLMQLLPSTAEELAQKKRMAGWSLTEPRDNILLGTFYLDWLRRRPWTSSWIDVLASYNGGGGNLRQWKRRWGDLEPELFIQSIPYRETRNYVRQVIVASAYYRYLETGRPPGEWLEEFYRPFLSASLQSSY